MFLRSGALQAPTAEDLISVVHNVLDRDRARPDEPGDGHAVLSLTAFREQKAGHRRASLAQVSRTMFGGPQFQMLAEHVPLDHPVEVDGHRLILRATDARHHGGKLLLVIEEEGSDLLLGKGVLLSHQGNPMGYGPFKRVSGVNVATVSLTPLDLEHSPAVSINPEDVLTHFQLEVVDDPLGSGLE